MVIEAFHGDINGEELTVTPADGSSVPFGLPPSDTTNYVNLAGFSSDIDLCINIGGALGDISWMSDNTVPIISVQSPYDIFAPYDDAVLIVPTTGDPIVQVQGAQQIGMTQEASGINQMWKDAVFDDTITQQAIENSATAGHPYYEGTYPFIRPLNSMGIDEGVVIDWWDPNAISPEGIPWNQLPHPEGGTFHERGLILNEGMSAEKARANIADALGYILPRTCIALDLPCADNFTSSTEELVDNGFVRLSPNPMQAMSLLETGDMIMQDIFIYNMAGQLVRKQSGINHNYFELNRNDLESGIYNVLIRFEEAATSIKLVVE